MEDECTPPTPRPNSGKLLFVSMLVTAVIVIGLLVAVIVNEVADNRAICERAVVVRDDGRAMWLAVFDLFPDSENIEEMRATLDELLPPLTCPPGADQDQIPREAQTR